jgi:ACS family hexuronate transporter-like MFS transporter
MNPGDRSTAPALSRAGAWALALTATLTMAVSYVDRQTLSAIAPSVQKGLGFDDQAYGLLGMAFAAAYLVGAPLAGRLVDRVGARRGLLGAVLLWSAVAALHALVPGFGALFTMRILLGLAEAPSFPAAAQTVHRALPPADHARGFGVLFTGSSIGAAIAPPLATWIADKYGFRAAFLGTSVIGLLWVPVWFSLAFSPAARAALDRSHAPAASRDPALGLLDLVKHPAVLRSALIVLACAPMLTFVYQWGTKYLVHDHHLTQSEAARLLWAPPLVFDVGAVMFGHLASHARARGAEGVPRSLVLVAAVAMVAGVAIPLAPTPELAVAAICMVTLGGGGLYALPMADMSARVPPSVVSSGGGLLAAAQSIAQIAANPAIGAAVKRSGSYTQALVALSLWVAPLCLGWLVWRAPPAHREGDERAQQPTETS